MSRIYVAVDLETTGTVPDRDAIVEVGLVKFRLPPLPGGPFVLDRWSSLVNPGRPIPYRVSRLTGISDADIKGAPRLAELVEPIRAFIGNYPVVGHNVAFELGFLQRQGLLVGQASLDTFELASILLPEAPRYSLGELARHLEIPFEGWHRAEADAAMAAELLRALWDRTLRLAPETLAPIAAIAERSRWPLRSYFAAALRAQASEPPPRLPAPHARRAPPSPAPDAPPLAPASAPFDAPLAEMEALLGAEGRVGRSVPGYEARPQQLDMLRAVNRALVAGRHLIVEAGTGTGKSLAYLLPAIHHALGRGERVVISTHTLNLQDQIFYDELARLSEALPQPFTAVRLKGRANYLCMRRLAALRERERLEPAEARLLARVLVWLEQTACGDRSELAIQRDEEGAWEQISADGGSCSPERCAPYGRCFWQAARRQAEAAHLVIVNHALLLQDLLQGGLIPPYRALIVDEAHHLADQATQVWGAAVSGSGLLAALDRLSHEREGRAAGLLARLRDGARADTQRDLSRIAERSALLAREVSAARGAANHWIDAVEEFAAAQLRGESRHRVRPAWKRASEWLPLEQATQTLLGELALLDEALDPLDQAVSALAADEPQRWEEASDELARARAALAALRDDSRRVLLAPEENDVGWIELGNGEPFDFTLHRAPRDVSELLHAALFVPKRAVVLTSATLSVEGSFAFIREQLGVGEADELGLGTPFDYGRQALVYVAEDLPEPGQPSYAASLQRALIDLARATGGRLLVLFTSKSQMSSTYHAISDALAHEGIIVLGQYMDGSRTHLVERFRTMERAVMLGTHSFWEGIDIPGEALSCVAITRLPFPVPTDPIHEARSELYDNPFQDYSVPQAVLRFRQGVGRLLRRTTDRGVIALLDSRLASKRYGATFLHSLPTAEVESGPARQLYPRVERWLDEERQG